MIDAKRWKTIEKVFNESVILPPEKRKEYVSAICGGDEDLLREVLTLLHEADANKNFLSEPVFEVGAEILASEMIGLFDEPVIATYELIKILGRGGTGVVYLATDTISGREVALKVLPESLTDHNEERIWRFQQEAKAASIIAHPNVARIYGFGKAENRYYLAMEYVSGENLRDLIKKKSLNEIAAAKIAVQIAEALSAAHAAGILHRDVKPENIIVKSDGSVKVLDFGLAKSFAGKNKSSNKFDSVFDTKPGMIIGTPSYMSPEHIRGYKLDAATDIWSLGVVFYEMLTNQRPFAGETSSDTQALILLSEPEYGEEFEKMPELKRIVARCLQKNAALRFQEAATVLRELETVLANAEVDSTSDIKSSNFKKENALNVI